MTNFFFNSFKTSLQRIAYFNYNKLKLIVEFNFSLGVLTKQIEVTLPYDVAKSFVRNNESGIILICFEKIDFKLNKVPVKYCTEADVDQFGDVSVCHSFDTHTFNLKQLTLKPIYYMLILNGEVYSNM